MYLALGGLARHFFIPHSAFYLRHAVGSYLRSHCGGFGRLCPLLTLPAVVQAQFTFTTNNGTATINGYTGPGGSVTIPSTTNALPLSSIGAWAFYHCTSLTNVTIPKSVTNVVWQDRMPRPRCLAGDGGR
jgi:hypothetical protein